MKEFLKKYQVEIALLIITPIIVSSYGIDKLPILKDVGFHSYVGQELARGHPLYSTIILSSSPLTAAVFASAMSIFYFLPQYLSIRLLMLIIISLLALVFYRVVLKISKDRMISVLSVLILISFTFFVELSLQGDPKAFALFFSILTIFLLFRGHYLLSGISASLSFLSWQALALSLIAPLVFPFLERNESRIKIKKCVKVLLGSFIPIILVIYFFFNSSVVDFIKFQILYAIGYETSSIGTRSLWTVLNVLGYYCSEFFFLLLGLVGILYSIYKIAPKIIKKRSLSFFYQNKYLSTFILPFLLLLIFFLYDFDDGSDLTVLLPIISISAALILRKIQIRLNKIISSMTHIPKRKINVITAGILILIVCMYGFLPAFQSVSPENPVLRDRKELKREVNSPLEMVSKIMNKHGVLNSISLFLLHRKGEQITINHQLKLAETIQNEIEEDEKILSLNAPEILFLSNRRNLNKWPLLEPDSYKFATDVGDIPGIIEDIIEYKPKFIVGDPGSKRTIERLELTDFIEKNYEEAPFAYYLVYRYIRK